jgi:protease IV
MEDYSSQAERAAKPEVAKNLTAAGVEVPWERSVLEKLAFSLVEEKRRARRWGIFFKLTSVALAVLAFLYFNGKLNFESSEVVNTKHTALVDIIGVLDSGAEANADALINALQAAFKDSNTSGVVIRINSPGGSPVQAGMVVDEIRRLKAKYPKIPLHVVVEEICASGGYYIAAAADQIYVDKASLIGSIGVLMDGFGFVGSMEKLGVERRLITAGANKGFLDSFSPMNEAQRKLAQNMVAEIHQQFIDVVRKGRGSRLKESPDTFSGLVWSGAKSIEMGLADGLGTVESVAREVIKAEEVVDFSPKDNFAEKIAKRIGISAGQTLQRSLRSGFEAPVLR